MSTQPGTPIDGMWLDEMPPEPTPEQVEKMRVILGVKPSAVRYIATSAPRGSTWIRARYLNPANPPMPLAPQEPPVTPR